MQGVHAAAGSQLLLASLVPAMLAVQLPHVHVLTRAAVIPHSLALHLLV